MARLEAQKLIGTALTDDQVPFRVRIVDSDTQKEFFPITDVQRIKVSTLSYIRRM